MIDSDSLDEEAAPEAAAFPWPPREGVAVTDALARTWSGVVFSPGRFFAAMPSESPIGPAIVFLLLMAYASAGVDLFWSGVLAPPPWARFLPDAATGTEALAGLLVAGPVAFAVTVLMAGVVHVALIVFGAKREPAGQTLRVLLFASATSLFQILPWIGVWVGGVWWFVVTIIGVREVHGAATGRAAAAVLVPLVVVSTILGLLLFAALMAGLASGLLSR